MKTESRTIDVELTKQVCPLGNQYAQRHASTPPKAAVISCEGMCLRGEISRRAANKIAHELAPEQTVRICHGGFLEASGGMRDLVEGADQVLVLDGCFMDCAKRLTAAAFPDLEPDIIYTDKLVEFDRSLFGAEEMADIEIQGLAETAAAIIVAEHIDVDRVLRSEDAARDMRTAARE